MRFAPPSDHSEWNHQLSITQDHEVGAMRRKYHLATLLGCFQVSHNARRDVPRVKMILGLIEQQWIILRCAKNDAEKD
jgi:hypothetical protein